MFRLRLHPTPAGLALGVFLIAFWALLWFWFLAQVVRGPEDGVRRRGPSPELTQFRAGEARRARA